MYHVVGERIACGKDAGWPLWISDARLNRDVIKNNEGEGGTLIILVNSSPESPDSEMETLSHAGKDSSILSTLKD